MWTACRTTRALTNLVPLVADVERRRRLLEHVLEAVLEPLLALALLLQPLLLARLRLLDQLTNANHRVHVQQVCQLLRKLRDVHAVVTKHI